ncbi:MAG: tRNA (adenosine(37)-N6)-threonylcarbamoyltransferase complex ATPase subunit type 1 TsaE [Pseudomonadota bacterium]
MDWPVSEHGHERLTIELPDLAATQALAARLAVVLQGGDVVALRGDLGVGKSELARALIRARAGSALEVPSPTFTIIQDYPLEGLTIRHIDLYRIADPDELFELGLEEAPGRHEAWLVEWPERAAGRFSGTCLSLALEEGARPDVRVAHIEGDQAWISRLPAIAS